MKFLLTVSLITCLSISEYVTEGINSTEDNVLPTDRDDTGHFGTSTTILPIDKNEGRQKIHLCL